jgi:uncharacterized membrane protein (TIGR02234 family)
MLAEASGSRSGAVYSQEEPQMSAGSTERTGRAAARRELVLLLVLGAAGAGLALLALRQGWAQVRTHAPSPLPDSVTTVTGQALVPAAGALALAALAGLAAILATRRTLRRIAGVILAVLGAGIAASVSAGISAADVLAASASAAAQGGSGGTGGSQAGSTTSGTAGTAGAPLSGFPSHVVFASFPWRGVALVGALAVVAAGAVVTWRAGHLPEMSSRYDAPAGSPAAGGARGSRAPEGSTAEGPPPAVAAAQPGRERADSASIWESLSRGEDPTGDGAS